MNINFCVNLVKIYLQTHVEACEEKAAYYYPNHLNIFDSSNSLIKLRGIRMFNKNLPYVTDSFIQLLYFCIF